MFRSQPADIVVAGAVRGVLLQRYTAFVEAGAVADGRFVDSADDVGRTANAADDAGAACRTVAYRRAVSGAATGVGVPKGLARSRQPQQATHAAGWTG